MGAFYLLMQSFQKNIKLISVRYNMTINDIIKFQDYIRTFNNQPIKYEEMVQWCMRNKLEYLPTFLYNNHYINRMKDGNLFIFWSSNKYYPEATIVNLKAELTNSTRQPTLEEQVAILTEIVHNLEAKVAKLEGK